MSFVSVNEAAVLVSKSTPTIYRHIKSGKLSRNSNGMIDTMELIRVYGELIGSVVKDDNQKGESLLLHENDNEKWLKSQIEQLQHDLKELKAESLARENRLMALLEHKQGSGAVQADSGGGSSSGSCLSNNLNLKSTM